MLSEVLQLRTIMQVVSAYLSESYLPPPHLAMQSLIQGLKNMAT